MVQLGAGKLMRFTQAAGLSESRSRRNSTPQSRLPPVMADRYEKDAQGTRVGTGKQTRL
jgi:hypothetical protein